LNVTSKKNRLLQGLNTLKEKGVIGTIFLLIILLVGNFVLQGAMRIILRTSTPFHTPISGSMEPTLKIGDLLIIQGSVTAKDIYAHPGNGDIVVFKDPMNPEGIPIVHRAIDKYQVNGVWYIVTKGDNNAVPDDWAWYFPRGGKYNVAGHPESYLIGKVIFVIPYVGYFQRALDETKITLDGYAVTLRMFFIAILIVALFYMEFTSSPEDAEEQSKTEKPDPDLQTNKYK